MNAASPLELMLGLAQTEMKLRLRRLSTLLVLLATVVVSWLIVADPRSGMAMLIVDKTRIAYESAAIAFGSSAIASMLLSLGGFYLVRGRSQLDLRSGCAHVLAASPISNAQLLLSRWCGAFAYLLVLMGALIVGGWALQLVRGDGPLQPLVFVQTYLLMLAPTLMMVASFALLFDAWAPLAGRRGDVLYFFVWVAQFSVLPATVGQGQTEISAVMAFDASGITAAVTRLAALLHTNNFTLGGGTFDATRPMLHFPAELWDARLLGVRLLSALLALLPLLPAIALFHRFDPQKVRRLVGARASKLQALTNWLLAPARVPARWLLALAMRLGGPVGALLAEIANSLLANPWVVLAVPVLAVLSQTIAAAHLPALLGIACLLWGIAISELPARDAMHGTSGLGAAVRGGQEGRFWRQWLSVLLLGLLFTAPIAQQLHAPALSLTLGCGLLWISSLACLLGQSTRGGRSFLSLFLFGLYLASQVRDIAWFDQLGFNGSADSASRLAGLMIGAAALTLAFVLRRRSR